MLNIWNYGIGVLVAKEKCSSEKVFSETIPILYGNTSLWLVDRNFGIIWFKTTWSMLPCLVAICIVLGRDGEQKPLSNHTKEWRDTSYLRELRGGLVGMMSTNLGKASEPHRTTEYHQMKFWIVFGFWGTHNVWFWSINL
jgi:hypothetical protein